MFVSRDEADNRAPVPFTETAKEESGNQTQDHGSMVSETKCLKKDSVLLLAVVVIGGHESCLCLFSSSCCYVEFTYLRFLASLFFPALFFSYGSLVHGIWIYSIGVFVWFLPGSVQRISDCLRGLKAIRTACGAIPPNWVLLERQSECVAHNAPALDAYQISRVWYCHYWHHFG